MLRIQYLSIEDLLQGLKCQSASYFNFTLKLVSTQNSFFTFFSKLIKDCEFMQIILDVKFSLNIECFHRKKVFVTCIMVVPNNMKLLRFLRQWI